MGQGRLGFASPAAASPSLSNVKNQNELTRVFNISSISGYNSIRTLPFRIPVHSGSRRFLRTPYRAQSSIELFFLAAALLYLILYTT